MAVRTFGKYIVGLKFGAAIAAPKPCGNILDSQFRAFGEGAWCEPLESELQGLRHDATERPDPQTNCMHAPGPHLPGLVQHHGQCAIHNRQLVHDFGRNEAFWSVALDYPSQPKLWHG